MKRVVLILLVVFLSFTLMSCKDPEIDDVFVYDKSIVSIYQITYRSVTLEKFIKNIDGPFLNYTDNIIYKLEEKELVWSHPDESNWYTVIPLSDISGYSNAVYRLNENTIEYQVPGEYDWYTLFDLNVLIEGDVISYRLTDDYLEYDLDSSWVELVDLTYIDINSRALMNLLEIYEYYKTTHPDFIGSFTVFKELVDKQTLDISFETAPVISLVGNSVVEILVGESFIEEGAVWHDNLEGNGVATITSTLDTSVVGVYKVEYSYTDLDGNYSSITRTVIVGADTWMTPTGLYNLSNESEEVKHAFIAAAEQYALENLLGGIPLAKSATSYVFSPRTSVVESLFLSVRNFDLDNTILDASDSGLLMYDETVGSSETYTYRSYTTQNPSSYLSTSYNLDDTIKKDIYRPLYQYDPSDPSSNYHYRPDLAEALPTSIGETEIVDNELYASIWVVPIREDQAWGFYQNEVPNTIDHLNISAEDYKFMLLSQLNYDLGGDSGNILNFLDKITGVRDYLDSTSSHYQSDDWIGISIEGNSIEFNFIEPVSLSFILNTLSRQDFTPIHPQLFISYLSMIGDSIGPYGSTPYLVGYTGEFVIEEINEYGLLLSKNINNDNQNSNNFTHKSYQLIESKNEAIDFFIDGYLDYSELLSTDYERLKEYVGDDYNNIYAVPGYSNFFLYFNGLQTPEKLTEDMPNVYSPEPILGYQDFQQAMYYVVDRQSATASQLNLLPMNTYFDDKNLRGYSLFTSYQNSEYYQDVASMFLPDTYGYDLALAKTYFDQAIEQAILDGYYTPGTSDNYTIIEIDLVYIGSSFSETLYQSIKNSFESTFINEEYFIKVQLNGTSDSFVNVHNNYISNGSYDLAIYGYSTGTMTPIKQLEEFLNDTSFSYTEVFTDDTKIPGMEIDYYNKDGRRKRELWSYEAIAKALGGTILLEGGIEATINITITATTPTSVTFDVLNYDNAFINNPTYTLLTYNYDIYSYEAVPNQVDIPITSSTMTINQGINPFFTDNDSFYTGEYIIVIDYSYVDSDTTYRVFGEWWDSPSTIKSIVSDFYSRIDIEFTLHDDFNQGITGISLLSTDFEEIVSTDDYELSDLHFTAPFVSPDDYILKITYDDGTIDFLQVTVIPYSK